jgi:origin recognition complex subunit 1
MSGDARRALEICRRAAEFADYRVKQSRQSAQTTVSAKKGTVQCTHLCWNHSRKNVCT